MSFRFCSYGCLCLAQNYSFQQSWDIKKRSPQGIWKCRTKIMSWSCWSSYNRRFSILLLYNKSSGLRPSGVGENVWRIAGKVIVSGLQVDAIKCSGILLVSGGQKTGIEAAIHLINMIYKDDSTDVTLLVYTVTHSIHWIDNHLA